MVVISVVIRTLCVYVACEGSRLMLIPLDSDPWRTFRGGPLSGSGGPGMGLKTSCAVAWGWNSCYLQVETEQCMYKVAKYTTVYYRALVI